MTLRTGLETNNKAIRRQILVETSRPGCCLGIATQGLGLAAPLL